MAALKCYLAIASVLDFKTKSTDISLTSFELMTGCSRPMVVHGIAILEDAGLVLVDRTRRTYRYTLTGFEGTSNAPFTKVPEQVRGALGQLPNRGESALSAIKILILLLALRNNSTNIARIAHQKIREYCGMQARYVRQGIDHLVNHRLVHVHMGEKSSASGGHPVNFYALLGDFVGNRRADPMDQAASTARQTTQPKPPTADDVPF
ncbi:hypothetical protein [Rhodanobacter sp. PCA2]|uniref:hypothetical protein n=1 Tax=Rhodanobacter sp. PCA2 TaxID=2006117 RepID=UPI0015E6769F|nr:hypothetical protein [Rhodanobacter sp. PCA2]